MTRESEKNHRDLVTQGNPKMDLSPGKSPNGAIAVTGLSVGILFGLSVSPVASSVIGAILAMVTAALAIVVGWERHEASSLKMIPLAWFVSFLVIGAITGIVIRSHDLLAPSVLFGPSAREREVAEWVSLGIDRNEAAQAIFAKEYPLSSDVRLLRIPELEMELDKWNTLPVSTTLLMDHFVQYYYPTGGASSPPSPVYATMLYTPTSVLYAADSPQCSDLYASIVALGSVNEGLRVSIPRWQPLSNFQDTVTLQNIVSKDLCPSTKYSWPWD